MAVAADPLVDAPLASPELALVDPKLAADLRRTHSPADDRWLRPRAPVEDASAEGEATPAQLESGDDAEHAASGNAEQTHDQESIVATPPEQTFSQELRPNSRYPVLPAPEPEEVAFADSPTPLTNFDEASVDDDDDTSAAWWAVAEVLREAEAGAEQVLVDEYIAATPDEAQTTSHYPVLPALPDAEATDATDVALRRIRESLSEADKSPSGKRRIRRAFMLGSGVVAVCAVAALGADVQLQVAHLPSWIPF
jgi:hypothetical protein